MTEKICIVLQRPAEFSFQKVITTFSTLTIDSPISYDAPTVLRSILSSCKSLTELHFYNSTSAYIVKSSNMLDVLRILNLKRLTLDVSSIAIRPFCDFLLDHCPLLEEIALHGVIKVRNVENIEIFYRFPHLQSFKLEVKFPHLEVTHWRDGNVTSTQKASFDSRLPWDSLRLRMDNILYSNTQSTVLECYRDVETLNIVRDSSVQPVLTLVPRYYFKLRHLILSEKLATAWVFRRAASFLSAKDSNLKTLKRVTLKGFDCDTQGSQLVYALVPLLNLPCITSFGLQNSRVFRSAHIYKLNDMAIEKLFLTEMHIDDYWIRALEGWDKLTALHFENCKGVTQTFVKALLSRCCSLKCLYIKASSFLDKATENWIQAQLSARGGSFVAL